MAKEAQRGLRLAEGGAKKWHQEVVIDGTQRLVTAVSREDRC